MALCACTARWRRAPLFVATWAIIGDTPMCIPAAYRQQSLGQVSSYAEWDHSGSGGVTFSGTNIMKV